MTGPDTLSTPAARKLKAQRIVKRYVWLCGGTGILPLPFVDQVLIGGLLAKMLHEICGVYGVAWSDHKIKLIAGAVLGGAHAQWVPRYVLSAFQLHQGALMTGMLAARPATAGAIAYALGNWFVTHFESGAWNEERGPGEECLVVPAPVAGA